MGSHERRVHREIGNLHIVSSSVVPDFENYSVRDLERVTSCGGTTKTNNTLFLQYRISLFIITAHEYCCYKPWSQDHLQASKLHRCSSEKNCEGKEKYWGINLEMRSYFKCTYSTQSSMADNAVVKGFP